MTICWTWSNNLTGCLLVLSVLLVLTYSHQNDDGKKNQPSGKSWNSFHHVIGLNSERKTSGKWKVLQKNKAIIGIEARMTTVNIHYKQNLWLCLLVKFLTTDLLYNSLKLLVTAATQWKSTK